MNKTKFYLGLFITLLGFYITINFLSNLTGFVTAENPIQPAINLSGIILVVAGAILMASSRHYKLTSRIHDDDGLVRLAEEASRDNDVQNDIDRLTRELAKGNTNPGLGSKGLFEGISYLRGRHRGRVFYRPNKSGDGYEILAKSSKDNEQTVINRLEKKYSRR